MTESRDTALLEAILDALEGIRQAIDRDRPCSLTRADRTRLERLLPAIAGQVGSEIFTSREIVDHHGPALRLVTSGIGSKQLGRLLTRAQGHPVGGYVVEHEGSEGHAALWRVTATL